MDEYNRSYWEDMYGTSIDDLPWEIKEAPAELVEAVTACKTENGRALDAGCGTGNFSVFLAKNGFIVTGVDYSEKAISIAQERNAKEHLPITYVRADLTQLSDSLPANQFDLILDYKVAHHLPEDKLSKYVEACHALLKPGGKIILICYSDKDTDAAGGKSAVGKFGNEMFYRTAEEIKRFYQSFEVVSYKEVMLGKKLDHTGHCFVFTAR